MICNQRYVLEFVYIIESFLEAAATEVAEVVAFGAAVTEAEAFVAAEVEEVWLFCFIAYIDRFNNVK